MLALGVTETVSDMGTPDATLTGHKRPKPDSLCRKTDANPPDVSSDESSDASSDASTDDHKRPKLRPKAKRQRSVVLDEFQVDDFARVCLPAGLLYANFDLDDHDPPG